MKNSVISFNSNNNNFNSKHRKETHFHTGYKVVTFNPLTKEFNTSIDCRIYDTPNRTYCAIWASYKVASWFNISATAYAGGYGYDRCSSAGGRTIEGMVIKLESPIDGVGSSATENALLEVAKYLCNDETLLFYLVKCNG